MNVELIRGACRRNAYSDNFPEASIYYRSVWRRGWLDNWISNRLGWHRKAVHTGASGCVFLTGGAGFCSPTGMGTVCRMTSLRSRRSQCRVPEKLRPAFASFGRKTSHE